MQIKIDDFFSVSYYHNTDAIGFNDDANSGEALTQTANIKDIIIALMKIYNAKTGTPIQLQDEEIN